MSVVPLRAGAQQVDLDRLDDERELIDEARRDRSAFARLYRRHYRLVANHIFRRTGDVHTTEDLVADVFTVALRTLPRYRYRGVPLRYWFLRLAMNAVNRWARRQRRQIVSCAEPAELERAGGADSGAADPGDLSRARRAMLTLAPKYQAVLALRYFEELGVAEIASVIGCRSGTVKSRLARARDALRVELERR